jgi:spoIIIJ-associated protein
MENTNELIKQKIKDLLLLMGFDCDIYERMEEGRTVFNIKTQDAYLLIGKQGSTLEALQHLLRLIIKPGSGEELFKFALDIDDYKDKRTLFLKELARKAARQVRDTKKPVALSPMPAYERRVVHNYLSLYSDVSSESMGRDPNRKIIIKPKTKKQQKDEFNFIENI